MRGVFGLNFVLVLRSPPRPRNLFWLGFLRHLPTSEPVAVLKRESRTLTTPIREGADYMQVQKATRVRLAWSKAKIRMCTKKGSGICRVSHLTAMIQTGLPSRVVSYAPTGR